MEHRSSNRVPVSGLVRIHFNNHVTDAEARDLGLDGMLVQSDADWLEPNCAVQVELALPSAEQHRTYRVRAFVVQHGERGTRLTFSNPDSEMLASTVALLRSSRTGGVAPVPLGALS